MLFLGVFVCVAIDGATSLVVVVLVAAAAVILIYPRDGSRKVRPNTLSSSASGEKLMLLLVIAVVLTVANDDSEPPVMGLTPGALCLLGSFVVGLGPGTLRLRGCFVFVFFVFDLVVVTVAPPLVSHPRKRSVDSSRWQWRGTTARAREEGAGGFGGDCATVTEVFAFFVVGLAVGFPAVATPVVIHPRNRSVESSRWQWRGTKGKPREEVTVGDDTQLSGLMARSCWSPDAETVLVPASGTADATRKEDTGFLRKTSLWAATVVAAADEHEPIGVLPWGSEEPPAVFWTASRHPVGTPA